MRKNRKPKGCVSYFLSFLISLALVTLVFFGGFLAAKGYQMFKVAEAEKPMDQLVKEMTADENYVNFDQLPKTYVKAVVSVEDKDFWDHRGLNLKSIGRAIFRDIKARSFVEGGSSITQQLMKNQYFSQDKELSRKFADMFAAVEFEKKYSKEEIFANYANTIYFGSGYYGIYDAAMGYYGKEPWQLSEYECIMLAGIPNAPSAYSPDVNPDLAKERMEQVIEAMVEDGHLTEKEAEELKWQ